MDQMATMASLHAQFYESKDPLLDEFVHFATGLRGNMASDGGLEQANRVSLCVYKCCEVVSSATERLVRCKGYHPSRFACAMGRSVVRYTDFAGPQPRLPDASTR